MESDLIPYSVGPLLPARTVLVLAPHPDDEVFGCGGAIAAHVRAGVPVDVVILTDGSKFGDAMVRANECRAAAQVLGYGSPDFWGLADRGLCYSQALVQRLVDRIVGSGVDLVYAPSPWEVHPDHRQATMVAIEAIRQVQRPVRLAFYEVGAPLRPNFLMDISAFLGLKGAAMQCFESQLRQQDYLRHIHALNQYRTYTLPREVLAAEAYWVLDHNELEKAMVGGLSMLVSPGLVAAQQNPPLVSILIRSMDRDCLAEALDSVALQTYPNIEVVLVAVQPNHRLVPPRCGPFVVRLLKTDVQLPRSLAANKAMTNARGMYFLFLDDDDWLMPGHIARLAYVLARQPQALAVYTGISLVDAQGHPMGQTFDLPFDAIRQKAGNLAPIHAVLFKSSVLQQECRFDEALDLYEDWDFWLQLAKLAPMVHLPGVSGVYRIHNSSGVHKDAGPQGTASAAIYRKWLPEWTPEEISLMMQRVWSHPELLAQLEAVKLHLADTRQGLTQAEQQLANTAHALAETEQQLANSARTLAETEQRLASTSHMLAVKEERLSSADSQMAGFQEAMLLQQRVQDALLSSHSWRITRPLRWLATLLQTSLTRKNTNTNDESSK